MKRLFILATAAIVALASCAKTEVVYTDAPEEIAFKAVTGVMTKAPHPGSNMPTESSMAVYAISSTDNAEWAHAFGPINFTYSTNVWKGETTQYWPDNGYMKFMAYYPSNFTATGNAKDGITLTVTSDDVQTNQIDILYTNLSDSQDCASHPNEVAMTFNHALAQIHVTAAVADENMTGVRITSVNIERPNVSGNLTLNGTTANWTDQDSATTNLPMNNTISETDLTTTSQDLGTGLLVVPGAQTKLIINYTIGGIANSKEVELSTYGEWKAGKKHVYSITVTLDEIRLSATVIDWDTDIDDDDQDDDNKAVTIQ